MFVAGFATQSVVSHFVESRHRQISLQASGAAGHTVPGGQSAMMRRSEVEALTLVPQFMTWLCAKWRSKSALADLLVAVCPKEDLKGLTYYQKVQRVYGADVGSQFKPAADTDLAISMWSKAQKDRRPPLALPPTPTEALCIAYIKSRLEVGASFFVAKGFMQLALELRENTRSINLDHVVDAWFFGEPHALQPPPSHGPDRSVGIHFAR